MPAPVLSSQGYNDALNTYMRKVGLDLTADTNPPKHLDVNVRILDGVGEIVTTAGEALRLRKHDVLRMRRVDAEPLIRQGKAKQLDS
jgi:GINS complex subunit 1